MENNNINFIKNEEVGTVVYVAKNDKFFGSIIIADEIKDGAKKLSKVLVKMVGKQLCSPVIMKKLLKVLQKV